jgi:hypothetical protein
VEDVFPFCDKAAGGSPDVGCEGLKVAGGVDEFKTMRKEIHLQPVHFESALVGRASCHSLSCFVPDLHFTVAVLYKNIYLCIKVRNDDRIRKYAVKWKVL